MLKSVIYWSVVWFLFVWFLIFWDRVFLVHAGLELASPASVSQVLELQVCTTMPSISLAWFLRKRSVIRYKWVGFVTESSQKKLWPITEILFTWYKINDNHFLTKETIDSQVHLFLSYKWTFEANKPINGACRTSRYFLALSNAKCCHGSTLDGGCETLLARAAQEFCSSQSAGCWACK
jgi:hypothetical protein